jgi:MFS family permease
MPFLAHTPAEKTTGPYPRRWWALLVLCLSLLIVVMANTSLIVAAPDMTRDLRLSSSDLQWVIDGYTVPYAALMLVLGAIGDKYSRRGALIAGLLFFAGGSVMGSLVDETGPVIAARAIMGVGAAVVMPATLSLLVAMFPRHERARAITAWTATSGLAIAVGPVVAGRLLEDHAWGSTFLINVPIAVLAVVGAFLLVPPSKAEAGSTTSGACCRSSPSAPWSTRSSRARTSAGAPARSPRPSSPVPGSSPSRCGS